MTRVLFACVALLLWAGPASAQWAVGAITGGFGESTTADFVEAVPSANTSIGDFIVVYCSANATGLATDTTSELITVTDPLSHTYTRLAGVAADSGTNDLVVEMFITKTTSVITTTDPIRCNVPTTSDGKTIHFREFNAAVGSTAALAGQNFGNTSGTTWTTGSVTGLSSVERLWLGGVSNRGAASAITCGGGYTCATQVDSGGVAATDTQSRLGWLIQTVTEDVFEGTTAASETMLELVVAVDEVPAAGGATRAPNCLLLGVC